MSYGKHAVQNCQNKLMQAKVNNYIFLFSPYRISDKKTISMIVMLLKSEPIDLLFWAACTKSSSSKIWLIHSHQRVKGISYVAQECHWRLWSSVTPLHPRTANHVPALLLHKPKETHTSGYSRLKKILWIVEEFWWLVTLSWSQSSVSLVLQSI